MPIAWYLFIDENGSSFATISDTTPVKKKALIITSERGSSLDDIYAMHHIEMSMEIPPPPSSLR